MKEYTLTKKSTNESVKAKSLTELSKATGINRSILARFYRMSKKGINSKSENMADYEPITKTIINKQKKRYTVDGKSFYKKKDIANDLKITKYQLNNILNGKDKTFDIVVDIV